MLAYEITHEGVEIEIHQEMDAEHVNPRHNTNLGIIAGWYPSHTIGDEEEQIDPHVHGADMLEVASYLFKERGALVVLPLFLLDHSGITIRAGEPLIPEPWDGASAKVNRERIGKAGRFVGDGHGWDTTMCGYIFTNQEKLDETGAPPEDAIKQLRGEVEEYDRWGRGEVYWYLAGKDTPFEQSCGGYICEAIPGDEDNYVEQEAKEAAEWVAEKIERESEEESYWRARGVMTVG